jgi:cytochrome P450 family 307 subfamily A
LEVDKLISERDEKNLTFSDQHKCVYTEAVILESLRLISSPIVPHVASDDSTISGYSVDKGTFIFLNNYELNMSPTLWNEPETFEPSRFISNNQISKPEFFIPFGFGRRSCMGYKMVHMLSFVIISNLMKDFTLLPIDNKEIKVVPGSLAVQDETYKFSVVNRH